jgi:RHS repeat-associated protein
MAKSTQRVLFLLTSTLAASAYSQVPSAQTSPSPVTRYEYYAEGNLKRSIAGSGNLTLPQSIEYDKLTRPTVLTDPLGRVIQQQFNARSDLTSVTDPRGLVTSYQRNGLSDLLGLQSPDTGPTGVSVDAAGNITSRTDARGITANYTYDASNRVTQVVFGAGSSVEQTISWSYDEVGAGFGYGKGRLTTATYRWGSTRFAYDDEGRFASVTQSSADQGLNHTVGYTYDSAGRLAVLTYPSGRKLIVSYTAGVVSSLRLQPTSSSAAIDLTSDMVFEPVVGGAGSARSWRWVLQNGSLLNERSFDASGRPIRYPLGGAARDVLYDEAGRITSYKHYDVSTGQPALPLDQSFSYDNNGRLTQAQSSLETLTFAYDETGNRVQAGVTPVGGSASNRVFSVDAASNRLLTLDNPARNFSYDASGNILSDQQGTLSQFATYDASGRLVEVRAGSSGSYFRLTRYEHNAEGQRVFKETYAEQHCRPNGICGTVPLPRSVSVVYVYSQDGKLIGEYSGNDGSVIREYVWMGDLPIALVDGPPESSSVFYIQADHLNTPRVVLDRLGRQRWTWISDPFGHTAPVANPIGLGEFVLNLRMPGQYYDAETGLSDNWNRIYAPSLGRYTQSDPIGLAGGINTYAYVGGNPLSYYDPYGLFGLADMPSLPDWLVDGAAGFGDSMWFGLPGYIRTGLGINGVDKCSRAYRNGELADLAFEVGTMGVSAGLKALAARASRDAARRGARPFVNGFRDANGLQGGFVHHSNPLFGHPGGIPTTFPTGGLPASVHSGSWNLRWFPDGPSHTAAHQWMRGLENAWGAFVNPATTGVRAARDFADACTCSR